MRFLKRHYEKLILSLVLLALAVAAAWLPTALSDTREKLKGASASFSAAAQGPYKPHFRPRLRPPRRPGTVEASPKLVLNGEHNLFNPVVWKRKYDGSWIKIATGNESEGGGVS